MDRAAVLEEWVRTFEQFTQQLSAELDSLSYEALAQKVEQREALIRRLQELAPTSEEAERCRIRIRNMLDLDERVLDRLHALKAEAENGLQKITAGRKQRSAYEHAYYADGVFMDKRK